VGVGGEPPEGAPGPPEEPARDQAPPGEPAPPREDNLLGVRNRVIVGVVFAAAYIATFGPRTGWAAAIVSGALGGLVFFLLLKEVDARRRRRR
jgi:hypothetical protein